MRKSLTDILQNGHRDRLAQVWDKTEAAEDFAPLPAGEYVCRLESGELFTSKAKGTPGYKLTFRIADGDHAGRKVWHDLYLTDGALRFTRRDLSKLDINNLEQLEQPVPQGIRCKVRVVVKTDDDGEERNRVRKIERLEDDPPDPFAAKPPEPANPSPVNQATEATVGGDGDDF